MGGRGIAVLAPVANLVVTGNLVERALHGIVMEERVRADAVTVSDNRVVDVGSREFDESDGVSGIQVVGARRASVESNVVHGVGQARQARGQSTGIDVLACVESQVAANSVDRVGFPESGGRDVGIAVRALLRRVQVAGNTSRRQPVEADEDGPSEFHGLLIGADRDDREPGVDRLKGYVVGVGEATFAIGPMAAYAVEFVPAAVTVDTNIVSGGGDRAAALIGVAGDVVCTGNQLHNRNDAPFPALRLVARTATVGQNRFRGGDPSAELDVDPKRLAVVGNLSTAYITVFGNPLEPALGRPQPERSLTDATAVRRHEPEDRQSHRDEGARRPHQREHPGQGDRGHPGGQPEPRPRPAVAGRRRGHPGGDRTAPRRRRPRGRRSATTWPARVRDGLASLSSAAERGEEQRVADKQEAQALFQSAALKRLSSVEPLIAEYVEANRARFRQDDVEAKRQLGELRSAAAGWSEDLDALRELL